VTVSELRGGVPTYSEARFKRFNKYVNIKRYYYYCDLNLPTYPKSQTAHNRPPTREVSGTLCPRGSRLSRRSLSPTNHLSASLLDGRFLATPDVRDDWCSGIVHATAECNATANDGITLFDLKSWRQACAGWCGTGWLLMWRVCAWCQSAA
jgi:hypothetical protein